MSDEQKPTQPIRLGYGLPMFLAAWIGANAQWAANRWPDADFIVFLTVVVLLLFLAGLFNRR